eukprot:TRINITY_DN1009_c0_g1_i4.p1 TRINITY_DN1009_c0_g1~~TRINITY_DN1009_c0_g1_i4.p1  ORF type:complete len:150 (+),score=31.98 TRINITY_DN1009_c0_g1_i4:529-978(+)
MALYSVNYCTKLMSDRQLKYLERRLLQQKYVIKEKIPEMKRALDSVVLLKEKKDADQVIKTTFELSEHVWANAEIPSDNETVFLWLGANVMVEYSLEEAIELLSDNITKGKATLEKFSEELNILKDQIVVTEVNTARVLNHDIRQRKNP